MDNRFILVQTICTNYEVNNEFLENLQDYGLISLHFEQEEAYLDSQEIHLLERILNLHNDLGVNLEGIDIILNLTDRIRQMQEELNSLHNRLSTLPEPPEDDILTIVVS
ncbi:MAG: hypothetical protein J5I59_12455 [Saprospiraceae bacterium]|nr:hypothetical protein [Saprospiraceae bacterium]